MAKISEALTYGLTIRESATDGSDFTNPAADYRRLFLGEDGQLHVKDSAGAVTDIGAGSGNVATDAIWDAAGDLVQGTGANTAAKLTLGAAGTVVRSTGSTNAYAYPPGYEFAYAEQTSTVNVTQTVEASSDTIVTAGAVTFDGSTEVMIEFFAPDVNGPPAQSAYLVLCLFDGSSSIGYIGFVMNPVNTQVARIPVVCRRQLTPSNASHTYSIRGFVSTSTANINNGAGGSGTRVPAYIRITKV